MKYSRLLLLSAVIMVIACDKKDESFFLSYTPSDSAVAYFQYDAGTFAVERLFDQKNPDTASVVIPKETLDYYLNALGFLYDKRHDFLALDTVISYLHVHKEYRNTSSVSLFVDTTQQWFKNIYNGLPQSGNSTVDSLAQLYKISFQSYFYGLMAARLSYPLNTFALAKLFKAVPGVGISEPNGMYDWDSKITFREGDGQVLIRLYQGYGDCPSGCFGYDYWDFVVTNDGKLIYSGFSHD